MRDRLFSRWGVLAVVCAAATAWLVASVPLAGQGAAASGAAAGAATRASWKPTRTADGHPDLQGYWTNVVFTPLERPKEYEGKEFLTEPELDAFFKKSMAESADQTFEHPEGTPVYDATTWGLDAWQQGAKPNLRTSIVIDPRDGKLPAMTPEAANRRETARTAAAAARPAPGDGYFWNGQWASYPDSYRQAGLGLRCLYFGGGNPPYLPCNYDNTYHIVQSKDAVAFLYERNVLRVVPLDGGPHLPDGIRQLYGDSRGRWEGETLVVETTNFSNRASIRGATQGVTVTERYTRIDETTIQYQFTVDDQATWGRPWTGELPMNKIEGPTFEYACHEGNRGLTNILSAARARERATGPGTR